MMEMMMKVTTAIMMTMDHLLMMDTVEDIEAIEVAEDATTVEAEEETATAGTIPMPRSRRRLTTSGEEPSETKAITLNTRMNAIGTLTS